MEFVTLSVMCLQDIQVSADREGMKLLMWETVNTLNLISPLFCEAPRLDGLRH